MVLRTLLISSLVAQLALSYQCCALLVIHPSLVCASPGQRAVGFSGAGDMCATSCESDPQSCRPGGGPCGQSSPCDDRETPTDDDGNCVVIPPIPLKDKASAIVVLLPAMVIAYLHRADFELRTPRATNPSTAPRGLMTSHARRALLSVWLN